ncbi:MAG: hypothetical protein MI685_00010 [Chlorobiales bacterium]|nr:hypothetical protein [Chlorobiales bacterium]
MAFVLKNLNPIGGQSKQNGSTSDEGAPAMWSYITDDTQAVVNTSGYFDEASNLLGVYDRISATVDVDGTPAVYDFIVLSNASGVVDVSDGVAIALTDSD